MNPVRKLLGSGLKSPLKNHFIHLIRFHFNLSMESFSNGVNRSLIISTLLVIFLAVLVREAQAGTLKIDKTSVDMGTVSATDYETGYKEKISGNTLTVTNTVAWKLMVKTNNANMGVIGGYTKPISDFLWKATGTYATQTTYISITNSDVEAARGPKVTKKTVPIDYKILLSWFNDVPGTYSLTVVYTLTAQ